jgi:hypothetical protein
MSLQDSIQSRSIQPRISELTDTVVQKWDAACRQYGWVLAPLVAMQIVVYSYFFTTVILTDHTFPNTWVQPYPSHRTRDEGRWLQDLIIYFQGGAGVQPFQMFAAVTLQGLNGILFARLLGLTKRFEVFLVAAVICLYPAILDTYCFASDHLTFAIGDTLALAGILCLGTQRPSPKSAVVSGLCFMLSLAAYGPKIALIGLLCLCHLAMSIANDSDATDNDATDNDATDNDATDNDATGGRSGEPRATLLRLGYVFAVFAAACLCYYASSKLVVTQDAGMRVQLNSAEQMGQAAVRAYHKFLRYCTVESDYLPVFLRALPAMAVALGSVSLLLSARRRGATAIAILALLLVLIPIALRASYIINGNTFEGNGRITYVNGYALVFFLAAALHRPLLKWCAMGMLLLLFYVMVVVGAQETNAAAMKTIYETNMVNRLAARIEEQTEGLYEGKRAIVVIGVLPEFPYERYVRYRNLKTRPHSRFTAFPFFRQVEILNFLFGKDVVQLPTAAQVERATASAKDRKPWPAADSVYVEDDVVVVLLQKYKEGVPRTISSGQ